MRTRLLPYLIVVALAHAAAANADQVGTVRFPISATAQAQALFEQGITLLHSFQYDEAEQRFVSAVQQDSRCAMCHWGVAMSRYQQLWDWPSDDDFSRARQELARARHVGSTTPRERAYITAAAAFFQPTGTLTHSARIRRYSRELDHLRRRYPTDVDAAAFYALSLVALSNEATDPLPPLRGAIEILDPFLRSTPDHPGVAHYLIHAADTPTFAARGLEAARRYAEIAPDSSHALHMPSHIFVRLGVWDEAIALNLRAADAGANAVSHHHGSPTYQTHALDYLAYAYLQRGEESMARHVAALDDVTGADANLLANMRAWLVSRNALDLHRWDEANGVGIPNGTFRAINAWWARTIGAARLGNVELARQNLAGLRQAVTTNDTAMRAAGYSTPETPVELEEAMAWFAFVERRIDDAIAGLRRAADREDANGGESITVPGREMLGDLFLAIGRAAKALDAYREALKHAPNRFNSLYGAGQAAAAAGAISEAKDYYAQLVRVSASDADRPELHNAQAFLVTH